MKWDLTKIYKTKEEWEAEKKLKKKLKFGPKN